MFAQITGCNMFELNKGVQNKDKDASEQRVTLSYNGASVLLGQSLLINLGLVGSSQTLLAVESSVTGISTGAAWGLQLQRFVVGSGVTTIPLNGSSLLIMLAFSTSGPQAHAIPAANTSLLLQGDLLQVVTSGAGAVSGPLAITAVLQLLQAVRTDYGV